MDWHNRIKQEGEFEYVEVGQGHPIIILHGLFGALSNFAELLNAFKDQYRLIVPIMPLYSLPLLKTGVPALAEFIHKFVTYKQIKNPTLLGNSLGGHVALVYTLQHRSLVHSLILTGSSGLYENAFGGSFPRREDKNYLRQKIAVTFYDPKMVTDDLVEEVADIVKDRDKLVKVLALAKSAIRNNLAKELPTITQPTCLIWGKNDNITPPHVAEEFHRLMPNSDLYWIDQCGHAPMMEHPDTFNSIMREWLKSKLTL